MKRMILMFFTVSSMSSTVFAKDLVSCGTEALRVMLGMVSADNRVPVRFHSLKVNNLAATESSDALTIETYNFSGPSKTIELDFAVEKSCELRSVRINP